MTPEKIVRGAIAAATDTAAVAAGMDDKRIPRRPAGSVPSRLISARCFAHAIGRTCTAGTAVASRIAVAGVATAASHRSRRIAARTADLRHRRRAHRQCRNDCNKGERCSAKALGYGARGRPATAWARSHSRG